MTDEPKLNTDREIWRGKSRVEFGDPDRFYADSIFVTEGEGIGMTCGGYVIVKPIREWFALANQPILNTNQLQRQINALPSISDENGSPCVSKNVVLEMVEGLFGATGARKDGDAT